MAAQIMVDRKGGEEWRRKRRTSGEEEKDRKIGEPASAQMSSSPIPAQREASKSHQDGNKHRVSSGDTLTPQ